MSEHPDRRTIDYENEERFHDEWGKAIDPEQVPVIESFEAPTAPENRFICRWLGDVRGLRVLDLGCGGGEAAVYFALRGAQVTAADMSSGMLAVALRVAERYGVEISCCQVNAERLELDDRSFDIVYAANLLHHVNLDRCLSEISRILTPDGRFVSWDPLRHNPIINVYRRIAAAVRTEDEMPLSIDNLEVFERFFGKVEHRCYWLASLWIFMRFFLIERVHPSKERYWKKIIVDAERLQNSYRRLSAIDRFLTKKVPWLERMCWNLVVCARNPMKPT
jgi:SAM-dependent methyltransferase